MQREALTLLAAASIAVAVAEVGMAEVGMADMAQASGNGGEGILCSLRMNTLAASMALVAWGRRELRVRRALVASIGSLVVRLLKTHCSTEQWSA